MRNFVVVQASAKSDHERASELATANQRLQFQVREQERAEEDLQRIIEELEMRLTKGQRSWSRRTRLFRARLRTGEYWRSSYGRHKRWKALASWPED